MGSLGNPQTWVPYENTKDCSQGFCSLSCPQWCYIIFPPPPPFVFPEEDPSPSFSPLVIAIIGILASAFLLVSYYTFISKYCGSLDSLRRGANHDPSEEFHENRDRSPMNEEPWQVSVTGLDEALIKSITVCKYKKGDGLVEETDCSVCLNEFQEDESLRLLPKCSHAFHLICIDTWLKSHPNCPLCRANIVSASSLPLQSLPPVHESPPEAGSAPESRNENNMIIVVEDSERVDGEEASQGRDSVPKTPLHGSSDLGVVEGDTIIEIRDEDAQLIRRSVSMDPSCQSRISIADILVMSQDDDSEMEDRQSPVEVGSSKRQVGEHSKSNYRSRGLHCVMSPIAMKRSFSGGRFLFTRHGRGRNTTITM